MHAQCCVAWLAAALALGAPVMVRAAESPAATSTRTVATIVTDTDAVAPGQAFHAALRLRLAPGWHTYWRNPGDAGIPPSLDLHLTPGTTADPIEWPLPVRTAEGTLTTYAYTGDVLLPFTVQPGVVPVTIAAHAEWLVCRDLCVPEQADFTLALPAGAPSPSPQAALIDAALARVPGVAPFTATLTQAGLLTLSGIASPAITAVQFFPTTPGAVDHTLPSRPGLHDGSLTVQVGPAEPGTAGPPAGVVALTDASGTTSSYEIQPSLVAPVAGVPLLGPLLLLAVAGGLLLNLMPCVFPILAMKALALARLSGADARRVRMEGATYCLGVVTAFVGLGAGLVALRSAGHVSDWGFQFQSPAFVTGIAWLLFAIGLSLSGVFTVGGSLMGRGDGLARQGGPIGSFLTGMLAVVVATPCTAPFMGTAVAGALALPNPAALAVFAALGVGLALPYGLIALLPRLSRLLPRPGAWMQTLQQLLAFPMYAATVWLVWIVSQQAGPQGVLAAGAGFVAVAVGAWAWGFAEQRSGVFRILARGLPIPVILVLGGLLYAGAAQPGHERAEPFTTARLEQLRGEGRPVFVNMTAAWCLSCLLNERVALSPAAVQDAFARAHVAYLKGDWTSKNPAISAFLRQLGQDGVPLYVLYAPGRPPVVLPQLLSEGTVLNEIAKLGS